MSIPLKPNPVTSASTVSQEASATSEPPSQDTKNHSPATVTTTELGPPFGSESGASPDRPIPLATRDDLEIVPMELRGQRMYVVADPLSMEHHRLNEQEMALLNWIDGSNSAVDIQLLFHTRFAPYQIELREIEAYLVQFHEKNLLQSCQRGLGWHLQQKSKNRSYRKAFAQAKSLLSFRFRGCNPAPLLTWLAPRFGWLFSRGAVLVGFLIMISAAIWLAMHGREFQSRLPKLQEFFSPANWLGLAAVVVAIKILHELAHGIVATRYGGRCHELGVSLLLFMPTLYVNTSGTWKLPNKWQRIAIAGAGMYVELLLASLATWMWWYARPGVVQYTALNVMASCSLSTLLINGNPLLKFDGYFMLSDWLEIPNLQERANRCFRDTFVRCGLGVREDGEFLASDRTKGILLLYASAAYAFRFVVLYGIARALCGSGQSVGLDAIARLFIAFSFAALFAAPCIAVVRFFWMPSRRSEIEVIRRNGWIMATGLIGLLLLIVPVPSVIVSECVLEPRQLCTVYGESDGVLDRTLVDSGAWVESGQPVAMLRNVDLELQGERLRGEIEELARQEELLRQWELRSPEENRMRSALRERRASREATYREWLRRKEGLTIRANRSGHVLAHWVAPRAEREQERLEGHQGWSLPSLNEHPLIRRGDVVCKIGDLRHWQARVCIEQYAIPRIRVGQRARVQVASDVSRSLEGTVVAIADQSVEHIAAAMSMEHGGSIEAKAIGASGNDQRTSEANATPTSATYEAIIEFDVPEGCSEPGVRGTVKVTLDWEPVATQCIRTLYRIFRFEI